VRQVQHPLSVAVKEERNRRLFSGDGVVHPPAAKAGRLALGMQVVPRREPKIRIRLAHDVHVAAQAESGMEVRLGRVVAGEHDAPVMAGEIARDFQVRTDGPQPGSIVGAEANGKVEPAAVLVGQQLRRLTARGRDDLADARPLGVPAVLPVVRVVGLGQPELVPRAAVQQHEHQRPLVPAHRPQRAFVRRRAMDAARAGHLGELAAADQSPLVAVPLGQCAGVFGTGPRGIDLVLERLEPVDASGGVFAVVSDDEAPLRGVRALGVPAGHRAAEQQFRIKRLHVHLVQQPFHVEVQHLLFRLGQMPRRGGVPAEHDVVRDRPDVALGIDGIGSDEQLVRLAVDHAVGRRAADALGADRHVQVRVDLVELVVAAAGHVRRVGDQPQPVRPRHDRPDAAFAA
jgi:hypothetical protein